MFRYLPMLAALAAGPAIAAPLEAPLRDQSAILRYEIEVVGRTAGKPLLQRLIVETPVVAKESSGFHPLARDFTDAQNSEIAAMSEATMSAGDGTADMLESNRLVVAMETACSAGESSGCAAARARFQAAEQRLSDRGAAIAQAQAQVVRRDEDDQRFLTFAPGSDGCGAVRYEHQLGDVKTAGVYPGPGDPNASLVACMTMVVLDRRDGAIALLMSPATLKLDQARIIDLERLQGVQEAEGLRFGALRMSVTLPMLPTAGPEHDYAGERTIKTGAFSYRFRWTLKRS
ncbi:hypothetical protein LJR164_002260 [Phenylobacterium sp. LjRoot164]|uniref:hypothetical protein n=1 Tax=unclassified Phenylobacterium TaxID=2640670 RepID=UPI003ECD7821